MAEQNTPLEEALVELVRAQASGVLEVAEDPKRWQFFLDGGALVGTRSNLKSETEEQLRKELQSVSEAELLQEQAGRRLANACRANATWTFKKGVAPAKRSIIHVGRALFEGVRESRDASVLQERLAPLLAGWPVSLDPEAEITATGLDAYLAALDGTRPGEDIVTFGPAEPATTLAAVWLGWRMGAVGDQGGEAGPTSHIVASAAPVSMAEPAPPSPPTPAPTPAPAPADPLEGAHVAELPGRAPAPKPAEGGPAARLMELKGLISGAPNHFVTLGMSWQATPPELRAAYMRLARDLHPDRYSGAPADVQDLATELFDRVRAAWEELGDEAKRLEYIDRVIHGKKSEDELAMEAVQRYLSAETDFKRGLAAFNAGQISASLPHFQSAAEGAPDETEFKGYYGYVLYTSRVRSEPETAIEGFRILEQAIADNKGQERQRDSLHLLLGRAWRERGDPQLARRATIAALKINPNNSDAVRFMRRLQDEEAAAAQKADTGVLGRVQGMFGGLFKKKS